MANWAVVIGIDNYWAGAHLRGAVRDALAVREWLLDPAGGDVPADHLYLLLAPGDESPELPPGLEQPPVATKANIIVAIDNLMQYSEGKGERLYFFFAGHGLTARVSNRDESALLATDFTTVNTDHSIALRSLWEFFETTQFDDQFFFVDACRNVPKWAEGSEFEIGRWTRPREREPGTPPVQQFILYATSPKLQAAEVRDVPGAEHGAFTGALLEGLGGAGRAKAWSWDRNAYEVRWERLADYVTKRVASQRNEVGETEQGKLIQVPQDSGSRGVADRERDVAVATFPPGAFARERLEVLLEPDAAYPEADVRVLDALGDVVAGQVGVTGESVVFELAPRTYALRAASPTYGEGRVSAPIDLYEPIPLGKQPKISLRPREKPPEVPADAPLEAAAPSEAAAPAEAAAAPAPAATRSVDAERVGWIPLSAPDPLTFVEVKDEAGRVVELRRAGPVLELRPGFYDLGHVGPEKVEFAKTVALSAGEKEECVELAARAPTAATSELLATMGGKPGPANTIDLPGCEPVAWAQTSTLVAMAMGKALNGETGGAALGLTTVPAPPKKEADGDPGHNGVALYVVSEEEKPDLAALQVRLWQARCPVPEAPLPLRQVGPRMAELVLPYEAGPCWLSIHREKQGRTMVFAMTVLRDRQATLVVQITDGIRLFQYQPASGGGTGTSPETLRRVEYLERMLLSGRLDGAGELALELKEIDDPFIGCLCGYVLLRLGLWKDLNEVVERLVRTAPQLSDGFVLRGEAEAATGGTGAKQAFAEAVGTGIPIFAEGLTRLLEGLRAHDLHHPRSDLVRYVFANHMRGSMWSVFTPRRFEPGKLVITGADTGHEA